MRFPTIRAWLLALLVIAFVAVTLAYSLNTPLFEGSDEPAHFAYVLSLAHGAGLPIFQSNPTKVTYELHQPPLYYLLCALAVGWIDSGDYASLLRENPLTSYDPLDLTNKNLFLHTRREDFPYTGAVLAIRLARLVSLAFGLGAVLATFGLARVLFPARPWLWYGAAAVLGFVPQFNFVSGVVNNDSASAFVAALGLWQLARIVKRLSAPVTGLRMTAQFVLLGVLLSAAALVKESALVLAPFAVALLAVTGWLNRKGGAWRISFVGIALVLCTLLLLAGWWFVARHAALGFWFGTYESASPLMGEPLTFEGILAQWTELEISFWGLFGWNIVVLPQAIYDGLHLFALIALAGAVLGFAWRRRSPAVERAWMLALTVFCLGVLVVFLRWMSATHQAHGRLLFTALPAFAILCCWGLTQWLPRHWQAGLMALVSLGWIALLSASGLTALDSAYPRPRLVAAGALPADTRTVNANLGDRIELLGYQMRFSQSPSGDLLEVIPYWQTTAPLDVDYTVTVQVFDEQGTRIGHLDTYPVHGMSLTHDWRVGQVVQDHYPLIVTSSRPRPVHATVVIGMYDLRDGRALQVIQPDGRRVARVSLGQFEIPD